MYTVPVFSITARLLPVFVAVKTFFPLEKHVNMPFWDVNMPFWAVNIL